MINSKPLSPLRVLNLMAIWWLFFLNVAYFFETRFVPPSVYSYFLFFVFICSFYAGGLIAVNKKRVVFIGSIKKRHDFGWCV